MSKLSIENNPGMDEKVFLGGIRKIPELKLEDDDGLWRDEDK